MSIKIGLEIHCQLTSLKSKLFCPCKADYRGKSPNTNICPTCIGLPGTLPRLNREAVRKALAIAVSLNCTPSDTLAFFRKNYFYPDLPKNYQITQLDIYGPTSIGHGGSVTIDDRQIRIRRIQLEEDPGRLVYSGASEKTQVTLVDYNRAGTPLVEIVTEPDLRDPRDVRIFLNMLHDMLENIKVADVSLEGAMRADANVSVNDGNRVEIKNVGSFHDLEKAVQYEITLQQSYVERGMKIIQETKQWDEKRKTTISARSKETDEDYRYFLERDIPRIDIRGEIDGIRASLPESITVRKTRYIDEYSIPNQVANILATQPYFSQMFDTARTDANSRELANIITTDMMGILDTRAKQSESKMTATHLGELVAAIGSKSITRAAAKTALADMIRTGQPLTKVLAEHGLDTQIDAGELKEIVKHIIKSNPDALAAARESPKAIHYITGLVMKESKGRADPNIVHDIIKSFVDDS